MLPEVVVEYGGIPTAKYATPSTEEVPLSIKDLVKKTDLIVLERHGSLTMGKTLMEAYLKLEKIEHTAQVTLAARQLGQVSTLSDEDIEKLRKIRRSKTDGFFEIDCVNCGACGKTVNVSGNSDTESPSIDEKKLIEIIRDEIQRAVSNSLT
ncbi:MAG: hypothetical protein A2161_09215 [Candidatus Schekmanbacteria bacterium RBG_13_48_7]|uniref:Class II aldolase/adducin N-terminal domain-containing protein n=1 Tax=Candidatus Schekmanbacteria bacterium RBG_13_48_7 TaxID=1817878 RepID=A0A1F7RPL4_9BACT|nr:MAG: hypothetical protein A2161_09215 [Candidatus Schekmanbacteria bacterium RBG_13_48_7]